MAATLTVLGAGSILPRTGYGCAGYALRVAPDGPVTLFDCGPGTIRTLAPAGIELADVRRVVFSHYHVDHCLDVVALAFARRNPVFEPTPLLELFGPEGLAKIVNGAPEAFGRWAEDPNARVTEIAVDAEGRGGFEADGVAFTCVRTGHTAEAVAWRADLPGGASFAYTGDTGENPAVAELARGADLFVAECSFRDEEGVAQHLTPSSAARLAAAAGVGTLLLTHFYPEIDPAEARRVASRTFAGPIELARDGFVFTLG